MIGDQNNDFVIPDVAEPIRAWRVWQVEATSDGTILRSPSNTIWHNRGHMTARCLAKQPCEESPGQDCSSTAGAGCGIYAYKDIPSIFWDFGTADTGDSGFLVFGEVLLWGRVFEHDFGYRAEHAAISKIFYFADHPLGESTVADLTKIYEVPVEASPVTEDEVYRQNFVRARSILVEKAIRRQEQTSVTSEAVGKVALLSRRSHLVFAIITALMAALYSGLFILRLSQAHWVSAILDAVVAVSAAYLSKNNFGQARIMKTIKGKIDG